MEVILQLSNSLQLKKSTAKTIAPFFYSFESDLTAKVYLGVVKEFLAFSGPSIRSLSDLSRIHIILYQSELRKKGLAQNTILRKLSAASSFCKHLAFEGLVERDLFYGIRRPKANNRKETYGFSDAEVKKIFTALDPKRKCYTSHRALLAVGFYTGLRSAEIRNLKIKHIAEVNGHHVLNLLIKGNKPHEVPLNPFCYRALSDHIEKLKELGFNTADPDQCIFPSLNPIRNQPFCQQALNKIMKARMKDAGIAHSKVRRYSPHSMRKTLAEHLLNTVEAPLEQVQRMLGHSSPTTTMRYNKRVQDRDKSPVYQIEY